MTLKERYQKVLVDELKATETRISEYREQQYKIFSDFKERAELEYNVLVRQLSNAPDDNNTNNGALSPKITHFDTPPTTPDSAPIESSPPFKQQKTTWPSNINNTTTQSAQMIVGSKNDGSTIVAKKQSGLSWVPVFPTKTQSEVKSADADCLFDLEGLDHDMSISSGGNYQHMDDEDDIDEIEDQLINPIRQYTKQTSVNLAKSLPISMPIADGSRSIELEIDDDDKTEDNVDIAASIKALAKSVHGDTVTVFGDLPRPRFSTQI